MSGNRDLSVVVGEDGKKRFKDDELEALRSSQEFYFKDLIPVDARFWVHNHWYPFWGVAGDRLIKFNAMLRQWEKSNLKNDEETIRRMFMEHDAQVIEESSWNFTSLTYAID